MAERKDWKDMTKSEKVAGTIGTIVLAVILVAVLVQLTRAITNNPSDETQQNQAATETADKQSTADKVSKYLDSLGSELKSGLASTSTGGYRGNIISVEQDGEDGVKVNVSTHFTESGYENDGGQNIAQNIFNAVCADVPELNSVYVVSNATGLESKSFYRSESACK